MSDKDSLGPLTFGFDIGIASVGWAVLNDKRIVDLGVRCFDKAETAKEGSRSIFARRSARLMRRRLRRRAWRMTKLARPNEALRSGRKRKQVPRTSTSRHFTVETSREGLGRKIGCRIRGRASCTTLTKHRGFHWVSRAEAQQPMQTPRAKAGRSNRDWPRPQS